MAAAEVSLTTILNAVSDDRGFGLTCPAAGTTDGDLVRRWVEMGLREFYSPPPVPMSGAQPQYVHNWSFLKPSTTFTVWPTTEGTISSVTGGTKKEVNSATDVFYPAMVGYSLVSTNATYTIATYVTAKQITVTADASADEGEDFEIVADGNYPLPSDFGWIEGPLTYPPEYALEPIQIVGEGFIRRLRSTSTGNGYPQYAAVRPNVPVASVHAGHDLCVYPVPTCAIELGIRYAIAADALTDVAREVPYGANLHGATILAACLATAERESQAGVPGARWSTFLSRLVSSINMDLNVSVPDFFYGRRAAQGVNTFRHGVVSYDPLP